MALDEHFKAVAEMQHKMAKALPWIMLGAAVVLLLVVGAICFTAWMIWG